MGTKLQTDLETAQKETANGGKLQQQLRKANEGNKATITKLQADLATAQKEAAKVGDLQEQLRNACTLRCSACDGKGKVPSMEYNCLTQCTACEGTGEVQCTACGGTGEATKPQKTPPVTDNDSDAAEMMRRRRLMDRLVCAERDIRSAGGIAH